MWGKEYDIAITTLFDRFKMHFSVEPTVSDNELQYITPKEEVDDVVIETDTTSRNQRIPRVAVYYRNTQAENSSSVPHVSDEIPFYV